MKNGDGIPGLVGWEWMGDPANIPGLEVVARGRVALGGVDGEYTATLYPGPKDNVVFNAATIWWADGLSAPPGYMTPSAHGATPRAPTRECSGSRRTFSPDATRMKNRMNSGCPVWGVLITTSTL